MITNDIQTMHTILNFRMKQPQDGKMWLLVQLKSLQLYNFMEQMYYCMIYNYKFVFYQHVSWRWVIVKENICICGVMFFHHTISE